MNQLPHTDRKRRPAGEVGVALLAGGVDAILASACFVGSLLRLTLGFPGAWIGSLPDLDDFRPLSFLLLGAIAGTSQAAPRTVTPSVLIMDCLVCPITVKKALGKVRNVSRAEVNVARRQAPVSYDDAQSYVEWLTRARRDAGYPSSQTDAQK